MRLGLNIQHPKELHQTAACVTFSFRIYRDLIHYRSIHENQYHKSEPHWHIHEDKLTKPVFAVRIKQAFTRY